MKFNVRHTRKIDVDDKFFIVSIKANNNIVAHVGWIEKKFDKDVFLKSVKENLINYSTIEVTRIREFSDRYDYEFAKQKHEIS